VFREDDDEYNFALPENLRVFEAELFSDLAFVMVEQCSQEILLADPEYFATNFADLNIDALPFQFDGSARGVFIEANSPEGVRGLAKCFGKKRFTVKRCRVVEVTEHYLDSVTTGEDCGDYKYNNIVEFTVKSTHERFEGFAVPAYRNDDDDGFLIPRAGYDDDEFPREFFLSEEKRAGQFAKGIAAALVEKCDIDPCSINVGYSEYPVCALGENFYVSVSDFDTTEKILKCINDYGRYVASNRFVIKSAESSNRFSKLAGSAVSTTISDYSSDAEWCWTNPNEYVSNA
jgi:hypothetical protein